MNIDHVVLWVDEPERSLAFYVDVMGMQPVRQDEFASGRAGFPSVRLNDFTILDLMARDSLDSVRTFTGGAGGGAAINHLCIALAADDYRTLRDRLVDRGIRITSGGAQSFGARGHAERSEYFQDPDGNVIEIRCYAD